MSISFKHDRGNKDHLVSKGIASDSFVYIVNLSTS